MITSCPAAWGIAATLIVLSGLDFTTLVLTTYALKTSVLLPCSVHSLVETNMVEASSAGSWSRCDQVPIYEMAGG